MHWLIRTNVGDVKMVSLIPYRKNILHTLGHKIFYRKWKINSMSVKRGNVEYIMTHKDQIDNLLELSCLIRNEIRDARNILQM